MIKFSQELRGKFIAEEGKHVMYAVAKRNKDHVVFYSTEYSALYGAITQARFLAETYRGDTFEVWTRHTTYSEPKPVTDIPTQQLAVHEPGVYVFYRWGGASAPYQPKAAIVGPGRDMQGHHPVIFMLDDRVVDPPTAVNMRWIKQ